MFDALLKSIYNKIDSIKNKKIKAKAIKKLEESILTNKTYKHQFENLTIITEAKDKKRAVELIKERNEKFKKESKMCCCQVGKENQKLAEFFNLNPASIKKTGLDEAIEFQEVKKLTKKDILKEQFKSILKRKSKKDLHNQLKVINFYVEGLRSFNHKTFIINSLLKLRNMSKTNLVEATKKAYSLRLVTEKLLREENSKKTLKEFQKDEDEGGFAGQTSPGKRVSLKDLKAIKKIQVEVPYNYKAPEKVVISLIIPFYPQGTQLSDLVGECKRIKKSVDRLERVFINKFIYNKGRDDVFQPNGTIWDGSMRENLIKAGSMVKYSLDIYINIRPDVQITWEQVYKEAYQILKEFDHYLEATFPTELSRQAQKDFLANNKKLARKTKYKTNKLSRDENEQLTANLTDDFGGAF